MKSVLDGYKPQRLFTNFETLTKIPRGSNNEKGVADFLCGFAKENGLEFLRDEMNNVLIKKPASKVMELSLPVILQGHVDMVCEKEPGVKHDFTKDPLKLQVKDGWLSATGTTLGADNGVAVAIMLTFLEDKKAKHPPLECLFTVQEEVGLRGAKFFDASVLKGKRIINLDSGKPGRVVASCAGADHTKMRFSFSQSPCEGETLKLSLTGFAGGHSSAAQSANKNAVLLAGRLLNTLYKEVPFRVASIDGGGKANAVPRECYAVIATEEPEKLKRLAKKIFKNLQTEFCEADKDGSLRIGKADPVKAAFTPKSTEKLINMLVIFPNGINSFSQFDVSKLESSSSLGIVSTKGRSVCFTSMLRSSSENRLDELVAKFDAFASAFGGKTEHFDRYRGWEYDPESNLREIYKEACKEVTGLDTEVVFAHGGLESGVIGSKLGKFDAMSTSAHIMGAHTPKERVNLDSLSKTYSIIKRMLEKM